MVEKESKKVSLIWYILPAIEIIVFFLLFSPIYWGFTWWLGFLRDIIVTLAPIVSIGGFFRIRKKSFAVALVNLIVGTTILILLIYGFIYNQFTDTLTGSGV